MVKEDGQGSQLNLTVVALVALVAIVGLVALVLNTASLAKISTGSQAVAAESALDENAVGDLRWRPDCNFIIRGCADGTFGPGVCQGTSGDYCGIGDI